MGNTVIEVGEYSGNFQIDDRRNPVHSGRWEGELKEGKHFIDIVAWVDLNINGKSHFSFEVDADGNIISIDNSAAANFSGNVLTFNTVTVTIDPKQYGAKGGAFNTGFYGEVTNQTSAREYKLIPNLVYTLDNNSRIGGSAMGFYVSRHGYVTVIGYLYGSLLSSPKIFGNTAATGGQNRLDFNTVDVEFKPSDQNKKYKVGGYLHKTLIGTHTLPIIPSLATRIFVDSNEKSFIVGLVKAEKKQISVGSVDFEIKVV